MDWSKTARKRLRKDANTPPLVVGCFAKAVTRHFPFFKAGYASPSSSKGVIKKPVERLRNGAPISELLRCQQVPFNEQVQFALAHLDCDTPKPSTPSFAVEGHTFSGR